MCCFPSQRADHLRASGDLDSCTGTQVAGFLDGSQMATFHDVTPPKLGGPGRPRERTSDTVWTNRPVEPVLLVPGAPVEKWATNPYGHEPPEDPRRQAAWWRMVRAAVFKKAKRRCQRCRQHVSLTVHHIVPRSEEGTDDLDNLVALCVDCHNWVECQVPPLRTYSEIRESMPGSLVEAEIRPLGSDEIYRPIWHAWVYGGVKNPNV